MHAGSKLLRSFFLVLLVAGLSGFQPRSQNGFPPELKTAADEARGRQLILDEIKQALERIERQP